MAVYKEYLPGEKHGTRYADLSDTHNSFQDCGYVLTDKELIVDIDNLPIDTIKQMIMTFNIDTKTVWGNRGCHFYFEKPKGFKVSRGVNALGFECEYKHMKNTADITVKQNGVLRQVDNEGILKPLPDFLEPNKGYENLLGLGNGDGRNSKLYEHKFKVMKLSNHTKILRFINSSIFEEPLEESELQTVIRHEELRAVKDGEYECAMTLIKMLRIHKYNDKLYIFDGNRYVNGETANHTILSHLKGQKKRYHDEVKYQIESNLLNVKEPVNGFDIKFPNAVLKANYGKVYEIESTDFTPYYIDIPYNEEAEPVETVDNYLEFLSDGDQDYKKLLLEMMAYILITDTELKGALGKFFFLYGEGENGKGTLLKVIRKILGSENVSGISPQQIVDERYFVSMLGKLCNLGDDVEDKALNEKIMKQIKNIATCDFVAMRLLFKQSFDATLNTTLIFTSNHQLKSFEKGHAYKRRVMWLPMLKKPTVKDPQFLTKITSPSALEYWLKLIIEAYYRLRENGKFTDSVMVNEFNKGYHDENNNCLEWAELRNAESIAGKTPRDVYEEYRAWAEEAALNVQSQRQLGITLKQVHNLESKVAGRSRVYKVVS